MNRYIFNFRNFYLNSLVSAKKWLSSTAIRIFSSSSDEMESKSDIEECEIVKSREIILKTTAIKRGPGRPRKDITAPKASRFVPDRREIKHRRSSTLRNSDSQDNGPKDGQVRFLLSIKALPKNLQILAKALHPHLNNKYDEHRVVCKILNDESNLRPQEIFIPTYRKLPQPINMKKLDKNIKEKVF